MTEAKTIDGRIAEIGAGKAFTAADFSDVASARCRRLSQPVVNTPHTARWAPPYREPPASQNPSQPGIYSLVFSAPCGYEEVAPSASASCGPKRLTFAGAGFFSRNSSIGATPFG